MSAGRKPARRPAEAAGEGMMEGTPGGLYAGCVSGETHPKIGKVACKDRVVRIPPRHYVYILDTNKNVTWLECGPQRLTLQDGHELVLDVTPMLQVPPMHFALVANPCMRAKDGATVLRDAHGQAKLRHGDFEVRLHTADPFPLHPGETVVDEVRPLRVVERDQALRLRAVRDFADDAEGEGGQRRVAGEEWLFRGPATYVPQPQVEVVELVRAVVLRPDEALVLRARVDVGERKAGETWLLRGHVGAFLPRVEEEVVRHVQAVVLTPRLALHLRANAAFTDVYGVARRAGEEWLVTRDMAETHIPDVTETVVQLRNLVALTASEYAVVVDPWDAAEKRNLLGERRVVRGPATFFLQPGESLRNRVEPVYLLTPSDALLVRAREELVEADGTRRRPGSSWLVYGPCAYVPPCEVDVRSARKALLALDPLGVFMFFWLPAPMLPHHVHD